jgi:hypothetical protein
VTPDPIGLEGGINLFSYSNLNPLKLVDPRGLKAGDVCNLITIKRKNIHLLGEDKYGHWWIELGTDSYGWWPKYPVGFRGTFTGVEGELNGQTSFGGTPERDAHHGDPAEETFHPRISSSEECKCKTCEEAVNCIRDFAGGYSGSWSWPIGQNCRSFQESATSSCCLTK